jgi:hypothetical protein
MTAFLGLTGSEQEDITFLRNFGNHLPIHTALHPRMLDSLRLGGLYKRAEQLCGIFNILPQHVP